MNKCPNCGSTAQMKIQKTEYIEDGWTIEVVRYYICECGETFKGVSYYDSDGDETVTPLSTS